MADELESVIKAVRTTEYANVLIDASAFTHTQRKYESNTARSVQRDKKKRGTIKGKGNYNVTNALSHASSNIWYIVGHAYETPTTTKSTHGDSIMKTKIHS